MRPVMLAIVGDSAAGKTTFAEGVVQLVGPDRVATGEPVLKPVYQHRDGTFGAPEYVVARRFMVIEGLLALHTKRMRDAFAVRVYLDPPEDLRRGWKVKRDCAKRGYAPAQVLAELERREPDSAGFIRPQRRGADIVVRFQHPAGAMRAIG